MRIIRGLALSALAFSGVVSAHGGGLNAEGCHNDRRHGGYHCHRAPAAVAPKSGLSAPKPSSTRGNLSSGDNRDIYYANCATARAAGAAPVKRGDPGYATHLDRDSDGVGCE